MEIIQVLHTLQKSPMCSLSKISEKKKTLDFIIHTRMEFLMMSRIFRICTVYSLHTRHGAGGFHKYSLIKAS